MENMSQIDSSSPDDDCPSILFHNKEDLTYTFCYCEENVWQLCKAVQEQFPDQLQSSFCVFISNTEQVIPLWCQKSSTKEDGCVIWDYHVIFIHRHKGGSYVYDHDTTLEFPCPFIKYAGEAIRSCSILKPIFHRYFRVVRADEYLRVFASDRSHMLDKDNQWIKPPPTYPCIHTQDSSNNLQDFISMKPESGVGAIKDYTGLCEMFLDSKTKS